MQVVTIVGSIKTEFEDDSWMERRIWYNKKILKGNQQYVMKRGTKKTGRVRWHGRRRGGVGGGGETLDALYGSGCES